MPPLEAQTPMAMTHFGSAIWSYTCRSTGAIFWLTRPATIIRSACRGVLRVTSMPSRAKSCRGAASGYQFHRTAGQAESGRPHRTLAGIAADLFHGGQQESLRHVLFKAHRHAALPETAHR